MLGEHRQVSRRDFVKTTALVGAGVASAGVLAACANGASGVKTLEWDKEVDVLAVGSSGAAWGALGAKDAGAASVLIIEKSERFGGTSSLSGGGHWIPNSYCSVEQLADYKDSIEDATLYVNTISEGKAIPELLESYLTNGPKFLEWSRDKFKFAWAPFYGGYTVQDYYQPGTTGDRGFGRSVQVDDVASMKAIKGVDNYENPTPGLYAAVEWELVRYCCETMGIEIMLQTAATKLIQDSTGAVVGVIAVEYDGTELRIGAKKGVILGTGGFEFNTEMRKRCLYNPVFGSVCLATNTGDGHRMAMEIGADTAFMSENYGAGTFLPDGPSDDGSIKADSGFMITDSWSWRGNPGAIVVNKRGQRFADESAAYPVFGRAMTQYDTSTFARANNPAYFICDSSYIDHYGMAPRPSTPGEAPAWLPKADTIEELAALLGVDPAGLSATVTRFNQYAAEGQDPDFNRGGFTFDQTTSGDYTRAAELKNKCLAPLATPPFYGAPYYTASLGTAGGLVINAKAQVLHVDGSVIPGLYACGCTAASVFGGVYPGGGSPVGATCVMGWVAGTDAAARV